MAVVDGKRFVRFFAAAISALKSEVVRLPLSSITIATLDCDDVWLPQATLIDRLVPSSVSEKFEGPRLGMPWPLSSVGATVTRMVGHELVSTLEARALWGRFGF